MTSKIILALDIGERHIGVATGDLAVKIATPLPAITAGDGAMEKIVAQIQNNFIDVIVVGLPRGADGQETKQSQISRDFAVELSKLTDIKIVLQDESLSSVIAEENLRQRSNFDIGMLRDGTLDSESATIFLQDYLEGHGDAVI